MSRLLVCLIAITVVCAVKAPSTCPQPGKMNKVVIRAYDTEDPASAVEVIEVDIPVPGHREVLVHMRARPVHPYDIMSVKGEYGGFAPGSFPATPGMEGMGVIAKLGAGVEANLKKLNITGVEVGKRVIPFLLNSNERGQGSFQDYINVNVTDIIPIPNRLSDDYAAQLVVNPMACMGLIASLKMRQGGWLLQSAGGSSIGKQIIQVSKSQGFKTVSVVRRCEQITELIELGADHVICTSDLGGETIAEKVMAITDGNGAHGALDAVGGDMTSQLQQAVTGGGIVLVYGQLSGQKEYKGSMDSALWRSVAVGGYWFAPWLMGDDFTQRNTYLFQTLSLLVHGRFTPHTGKHFALAAIKEAFRESVRDGRSSDGKVMLTTHEDCMRTGLKQEL